MLITHPRSPVKCLHRIVYPEATLRGPDILLRPFQVEDLPVYAAWMAPGHRWRTLDGPYYPAPTTEQIASRMERIRARLLTGPPPSDRLVIAARGSGALVGTVSRYWQSQETNWLSLGISLYDPAHWGQGWGHQALGLWCQHLFDGPLELARLDLRTWSGNIGMMRLAEKLGFTREATFRRARVVNGEYYDGLGYGILREEWRARYPGGFAAQLS